jgi:hypothetical protein
LPTKLDVKKKVLIDLKLQKKKKLLIVQNKIAIPNS